MKRRVSDLQLERYLAEALPPAQVATLEATLRDSAEDQAALEALRADSAAFFVAQPPAAFAHRLAPARGSRWRWLGGLVAATAALSLTWLVVLRPPTQDDEVRTKGGHAWGVSVARGGQVRAASEASPLHAGDVLSFQVTTPSPAFAAVLALSADGFQVYAPLEAVPSGVTVLGQAAQLDALSGPEVLHLLLSARAFDVEQVRQALVADPTLTNWGVVAIDRRRFTKE
jgi:hypothetical protein